MGHPVSMVFSGIRYALDYARKQAALRKMETDRADAGVTVGDVLGAFNPFNSVMWWYSRVSEAGSRRQRHNPAPASASTSTSRLRRRHSSSRPRRPQQAGQWRPKIALDKLRNPRSEV